MLVLGNPNASTLERIERKLSETSPRYGKSTEPERTITADIIIIPTSLNVVKSR